MRDTDCEVSLVNDHPDQDLRRNVGPAEHLLNTYYMSYCDFALEDFCGKFCRCEYEKRNMRCVNVREGHSKGHQNEKGAIIGTGPFFSSFNEDVFDHDWLRLLQEKTKAIQHEVNDELAVDRTLNEKKLTSKIHRRKVEEFYKRVGGARLFISHSTCFCCLRDMPEHPLPCGHVLCISCILDYGILRPGSTIQIECCPLHPSDRFSTSWDVKYKPKMAGVRILSLDG